MKFSSFKIVNVLGTCSLPFGILLTEFSNAHIGTVQYEPELHPGATYQIKVGIHIGACARTPECLKPCDSDVKAIES